ncbi:hypothetical protein BC936DRAFT_140778 [Jimgerdemannia flammicorona]|uniref:Uncharacterized protein n=1 Tax=Jimgerdemannia flammicorona TaxID=994334 RepID=A0A433DGM3_9FUNG|nr:hypothetical protein BC936DRAFT_140778 [Jimgerdemannia flammicorona]
MSSGVNGNGTQSPADTFRNFDTINSGGSVFFAPVTNNMDSGGAVYFGTMTKLYRPPRVTLAKQQLCTVPSASTTAWAHATKPTHCTKYK